MSGCVAVAERFTLTMVATASVATVAMIRVKNLFSLVVQAETQTDETGARKHDGPAERGGLIYRPGGGRPSKKQQKSESRGLPHDVADQGDHSRSQDHGAQRNAQEHEDQ